MPDITKIRETIGWEPKRTLDQIVTDVRDDQLAARGVASLAA
jgi:hypothetical protein